MSDTQRLPMEIILHLIDSFINNPRAIYSPSDDVTKTLLSFTLVCRATYAHASNHLRRQCMFIDTGHRMKRCIYYLKATNHLVPEYNLGKIDDFRVTPPRVRLCPVPSLYLAIARSAERQLYDRSMMDSCTMLLTLIRRGLKRLILDIPFECYCAPDAWGNVFPHPGQSSSAWPYFVAAFSSLTELEEVVNLEDSRCFPCLQTNPGATRPVWALWPNLRRFALSAAGTSDRFWQNMRRSEMLELLVLGSPWTIRSCLKTAYLQPGPSNTEATKPPTPLKVVFAASPQDQPRNNSGRCLLWGSSDWPAVDPDKLITVSLHDLPPPALEARSPRSETREHMRTAALRDEIWDWQGEIVS